MNSVDLAIQNNAKLEEIREELLEGDVDGFLIAYHHDEEGFGALTPTVTKSPSISREELLGLLEIQVTLLKTSLAEEWLPLYDEAEEDLEEDDDDEEFDVTATVHAVE